jgi:hypothetical protein
MSEFLTTMMDVHFHDKEFLDQVNNIEGRLYRTLSSRCPIIFDSMANIKRLLFYQMRAICLLQFLLMFYLITTSHLQTSFQLLQVALFGLQELSLSLSKLLNIFCGAYIFFSLSLM